MPPKRRKKTQSKNYDEGISNLDNGVVFARYFSAKFAFCAPASLMTAIGVYFDPVVAANFTKQLLIRNGGCSEEDAAQNVLQQMEDENSTFYPDMDKLARVYQKLLYIESETEDGSPLVTANYGDGNTDGVRALCDRILGESTNPNKLQFLIIHVWIILPDEERLQHFIPVILRRGKWYFCPGEEGGNLLMCSASNLVRLLTEENMMEFLLGFLKEPYNECRGEARMGIENLISTYCGGKNCVDVLEVVEDLTAVQKRSGIPVMKGGDMDWNGEGTPFNLCVSNKFRDLDVEIGRGLFD